MNRCSERSTRSCARSGVIETATIDASTRTTACATLRKVDRAEVDTVGDGPEEVGDLGATGATEHGWLQRAARYRKPRFATGDNPWCRSHIRHLGALHGTDCLRALLLATVAPCRDADRSRTAPRQAWMPWIRTRKSVAERPNCRRVAMPRRRLACMGHARILENMSGLRISETRGAHRLIGDRSHTVGAHAPKSCRSALPRLPSAPGSCTADARPARRHAPRQRKKEPCDGNVARRRG